MVPFFTRCAGRLREKAGDGGRKSVQHLIRKRADDKDFMEIRVAVVGNVDAGKSTLLGKSNAYVNIKGQPNEIFTSDFFTDGLLPSNVGISRLCEFGFDFNEKFAIYDRLPLLFKAESGYSQYCFLRSF